MINSAEDLNQPLEFEIMDGQDLPLSENGYSVSGSFFKSASVSYSNRAENYLSFGDDIGFRNYLGLNAQGRLYEMEWSGLSICHFLENCPCDGVR